MRKIKVTKNDVKEGTIVFDKKTNEKFIISWNHEFFQWEFKPFDKKLQKWRDNYAGVCINKKEADKHNYHCCTACSGYFWQGLDEVYKCKT